MGKFVAGDVVAVAFPFSDLSGQKLRPALVLAEAEFNNVILCQITSKPYSSSRAITIGNTAFAKGGLPITSYVRPDKPFTAEPIIIEKVLGTLNQVALGAILTQVKNLFGR